MGAKKEILQEGLDAAGKAVTGLPTAVAGTDAVPLAQMTAAIAAVSGAAVTLASTPPADATKSAAAVGVGTTAARADHKHDVSTAAPVSTGTANTEGTSTALARADHTHLTSFAGVSAALAAATTDVALNSHKVTGIADATAAQDAVAFHQLDRTPKAGEFWVYLLDYDGAGSDTTGVAGIATTAASALAAALPLKTFEKLGQILPRTGNGATLVVLVKPRTAGATYRNIANSADQDGSWLNGLAGWNFVARGSLDFVNDTNDKIRAGFLTLAGTNAPGYKTTAGTTTTSLVCQQVGGGAAGFTAESAGTSPIMGYRIRYLATTPTVALQNFCSGIIRNTTTIIEPMSPLPATPLPSTDPSGGDIFVIEGPGVAVGTLTHTSGEMLSFSLVGFSATAASTMITPASVHRLAGCNLASLILNGGDQYVAGTSYVDEAKANITVGYGIRVATTFSSATSKSVTVSSSSWLSTTSPFTLGSSVLSVNVGAGCVCVVGIRYPGTKGIGATTIGSNGSASFARFRVTFATFAVGFSAIDLGGLGATVRGCDLNNCNQSAIALDSTDGGYYWIDDCVSRDGGNTHAAPFYASVLKIAAVSHGTTRGVTVKWGFIAANTITADRDVNIAGQAVHAQFSYMATQGLNVWGNRIDVPQAGGYYNDLASGPTVVIESDDRGFFGGGPFPPGRVIQVYPFTTIYQGRPAIADVDANCNAILGVCLNYAPVAGDLFAVAQAGPVYVEFTSTPSTGRMAYLRQDGGANSGMAQDTPPTSGLVIPLGTIHSTSGNYGLINLIPSAGAYVSRDGHVAESVVANPTGAQGTAVDVALGTDQVLGRLGSAHVAGIPISSISGVPVGGHVGFSVLGKATTGTGNAADIPVGTSAVVGRSGSGDVASIAVGGGVEFSGAALQRSALTGDVSAPAGSGTTTIQAGAVTNAKRANMAANTLSGNNTGSPAAPSDLTAAAVKTLLAISLTADVTGVLQAAQFPALTGDVTTPGGSLATTLANLPQAVLLTRAAALTAPLAVNGQKITGLGTPTVGTDAATKAYVDASFSGGVPLVDGDKGDITVSGSGATWTIDNGVIIFAKFQNIPTDSLVGRDTAGSGAPESIGVTGGIEFDGSGNIRRAAITGDVVISAGSAGAAIAANAVTNAQLADVPTGTLKGRTAAGTGDPTDLTFAAVKTALAISFLDISGTLQAAQFPALTGDVTTAAGSLATTLASTGVTAGTYGDGSHSVTIQVDAKGRVLAISAPSISISAGAVSGLAAIATTGSGADLTANSVSDAKLRQGGALSVIGRSANITGNVADIASSADHQVLRREGSTVDFGQVTNGMIADGAITLPKHSAFPALSVLGNPTLPAVAPTYVGMTTLRTMLGLDVPQTMDLWFAFGRNDGNNTDSELPASVGGNASFFMRSAMLTGDAFHAYFGGNVDISLDSTKVWDCEVTGDFSIAEIDVFVYFAALRSTGGADITAWVTRNGLREVSPFGVSFSTTGRALGTATAYSFADGDRLGVLIAPNANVGNNGTGQGRIKFTVHVRLTR